MIQVLTNALTLKYQEKHCQQKNYRLYKKGLNLKTFKLDWSKRVLIEFIIPSRFSLS